MGETSASPTAKIRKQILDALCFESEDPDDIGANLVIGEIEQQLATYATAKRERPFEPIPQQQADRIIAVVTRLRSELGRDLDTLLLQLHFGRASFIRLPQTLDVFLSELRAAKSRGLVGRARGPSRIHEHDLAFHLAMVFERHYLGNPRLSATWTRRSEFLKACFKWANLGGLTKTKRWKRGFVWPAFREAKQFRMDVNQPLDTAD
jgi:hypothetical protein